jgi:4-hydroxy-L-threonine phosphate dehydrogenase PdxA
VNISTVVALVTAPVHKGVINDAGIAFNPIRWRAKGANILAKI